MPSYQIICGNSREVSLRFANQVDLIVTSPPYADARRGHYESMAPQHYAEWFATFHPAFWQALKPSGSLVINIKDKVVKGVRYHYVWKTVERLVELGWFSIDDYIWVKKNPMPGRWPSRLRDGWEYCLHLAKSTRPFIDPAAVQVPMQPATQDRLKRLRPPDCRYYSSRTHSGFGCNLAHWLGKTHVLPSNVLHIATETHNRHHPAVFPVDLPSFFIKLLSPPGGLVLDPFAGSGTTGDAALRLGRQAVLIDNNPTYCAVAEQRLQQTMAHCKQ